MKNADDIIKFRFTAYLVTSVQNHKRYLEKIDIKKSKEVLSENLDNIASAFDIDEYSYLFKLAEFSDPHVQVAFDRLKEKELQVIILHVIEGLSIKEISEMLGLKYKTAHSIYSRAMDKIRDEVRRT